MLTKMSFLHVDLLAYCMEIITTRAMGGDLAPNLRGPKKCFAAQFQEKFPFSE